MATFHHDKTDPRGHLLNDHCVSRLRSRGGGSPGDERVFEEESCNPLTQAISQQHPEGPLGFVEGGVPSSPSPSTASPSSAPHSLHCLVALIRQVSSGTPSRPHAQRSHVDRAHSADPTALRTPGSHPPLFGPRPEAATAWGSPRRAPDIVQRPPRSLLLLLAVLPRFLGVRHSGPRTLR